VPWIRHKKRVKRLWDEDTHARIPLKVVLLGSAPMLILVPPH
jgi:hypothetical protein